jgi:hypothetical protein
MVSLHLYSSLAGMLLLGIAVRCEYTGSSSSRWVQKLAKCHECCFLGAS